MKYFYSMFFRKLWILCLCLGLLPGGFTYAATVIVNKVTNVSIASQIAGVANGDTIVIQGDDLQSSAPNDWYTLKTKASTVSYYLRLETSNTSVPGYQVNGANLKGVSMPNVQTLLAGAFSSCTNLEYIDLPLVQTIGNYTFQNCSSLVDIYLPEVETLDQYVFQNCVSLTIVDLPKVQTIGRESFRSSGVTNFTAPQLQTLSDISTFYQCANLTSIDIPKVQNIPQNTFFQCSSLTNIDMSNMTTIGNGAFYQCSSLTNANCSKATSIGNTAFQTCTNLTSADLSSVLTIGNSTFSGCANLAGIKLPNATSIGNFTFNACTNLTELDAPKLQTIGNWAFNGASGLTEINLPTVLSLGTNAFENCSNLVFAILHNLSNLGTAAFRNCPALKYMELGDPPAYTSNSFDGTTGAVLIVVPDTMAYRPFPLATPYSAGSEVHLRRVSTESRMFNPDSPETLVPLRFPSPNTTLAGGGTFVWKKDGYPISGANSISYTPTEPGWYTLEFTHGGTVILQSVYLAAKTVQVPDWRAHFVDCIYTLTLTFSPSNADRTVTVYTQGSGAAYVKDVASGKLLKDSVTYKLPKNTTMLEIPYEVVPGMGNDNQVQFVWQASDSYIVYDTDMLTLYDKHTITHRYIRPTAGYPGLLEVEITGGSYYIERSLDGGRSWEWARDLITGASLPFSKSQINNLDVPYLLFRQSNACASNDTIRLYGSNENDTILRMVLMPPVTDAVSSVIQGEHFIHSRENFTFTLTGVKPGYVPHVSTSRVLVPDSEGLLIERIAEGTYKVTILQIQEPVVVSIDFEVGNEQIESARIWGSEGMLYLQSDELCEALVHTLSGVLVQKIQLTVGELQSMPLEKGCYFVTIGKKTYKVIL